MNKKLIVLYALLALFIGLGIFAAYSFFSNIPEAEEDTDPPYEFADITALPGVQEEAEQDADPSFPGPPIVDADALRAQNEDFLGWLYIPETYISFPVVKATDNAFYLKHGFNGYESAYGCPFVDTRTAPESGNIVIHGHNMGNNRTEMFSPLLQYQAQAYAELHETAQLIMPGLNDGEEEYRLFAVLNFNINTDFDYIRSDFLTDDDRADYISYLQSHSIFRTDFTPENETFILSTCNRTYGADNRLLICFGR